MSSIEPVSPVLRKNATTLLRRIARRVRRRSTGVDPALKDIAVIEASQRFDKEWYKRRYPDVMTSGMDPIEHYVRHGAAEGRDPGEGFNTAFYLRNNPDVAASGINPFLHYLEYGRAEGRASRLSSTVIRAPSDAEVIAQSGLFDSEFYSTNYPDVLRSGIDALEHYLKYGAAEGRNPCALFDTSYYLTSNPDVAASGLNPLLHFCKFGWKEMRNPSAEFDTAWYWITRLAESQPSVNPLAHYFAEGRSQGVETRMAGQLSPEDKDRLATICTRLLDREDHDAVSATSVGLTLLKIRRWADAEAAFRVGASLARNDARAHNHLAVALEKQGKWWQVVDALKVATALDASRAGWFYRLGDAQEKMNRFASAAEAFQHAIDLDSQYSLWHYRLGYALEKSDQSPQAASAYAEAIRHDPSEDIKRFGIGGFHQRRGYWPEAAAAYATRLREDSLDAELHFKLGMAQDRCYRWQEALAAYRNGLVLKPTAAYWHYRCGFVLERLERFEDAAEAYSAACALSTRNESYWRYRQGYVLALDGKHEDACWAYAQTLPQQMRGPSIGSESNLAMPPEHTNIQLKKRQSTLPDATLIEEAVRRDTTRADLHYLLGLSRENAGDLTGAAGAYRNAVARSDDHQPGWYYRLGFVLLRAGRFAEACDSFRETRILRRPYGVDSKQYEKNISVKENMQYNEYVDTLEIRPRTILYESYHGSSLSCNPLAIFKHLLDHPDFSDWTHVWSIADKAKIGPEYRVLRNVIFVARGSDLYRRYLASASHLINNNTFASSFVRRSEQQYLNTWHGTPIKGLGKDIHDQFMAHRNAARNLLHATHVLSPNKHTSDVLIRRNDIAGIFSGKIAEVGYPRVDRLVNATPQSKAALRTRLGVTENAKIVLYAPTWRGTLHQVQIDTARLVEDLETMAQGNHHLLFKGHHMHERMLDGVNLPVSVVSDEIDTCELLSIVDVLITDYSSIWVDFLPANKPIIYYVYDLDSYLTDRGLYFDIQDLPGRICRNRNALVAALRNELESSEGNAEKYEKARAYFCPQENGGAASRAVEFFFGGDESYDVTSRYCDNRFSLLMYVGGFLANGITASCLNLLKALDSGKYNICVAIDPASVGREPGRLKRFGELPEAVQVLGRIGETNWTPEQRWISGRFRGRHRLDSPGMWKIYEEAYKQEFVRMFGAAKFGCLVQFEGYTNFWTSLLAFGGSGGRIIYLHNDMTGEMETRFTWLQGIFSLYKHYDKLVSVSESVDQSHRQIMPLEYGLPLEKFVYANNPLDVDDILAKASDGLSDDISEWAKNATLFATLGRLEPQKGHKKLINAFCELQKHVEKPIKLIIAGDGSLRHELQLQVDDSGLHDQVCLVGHLENPYPLLRRMDLFVFSSEYEGQGIAILEALALGKPVIATDVVGSRAVLEGGFGLLVENSEAGLVAGMLEFLQGRLSCRAFEARAYQSDALRRLDELFAGSARAAQPSRNLSELTVRETSRTYKTNRVIVAAREDGLGERMNALLNGMFLAEKLGFDFAYQWKVSGTWEGAGVEGSHHAVVHEKDLFSSDFISKYSLKEFDKRGFVEVGGEHLTREQLMAKTGTPGFRGWLAPRLDLNDLLSEEMRPDANINLRMTFRKIGFGSGISHAIRAAEEIALPANCVALHLRSGDIFYGRYRKFVYYTYKGITLPIAKAMIQAVQENRECVLLFGQDKETLNYLKNQVGAVLLKDLVAPVFESPAEQAIFEMVLMSRCKYIIAGSSGFAKQASWIGGIEIKHPKDFFDHREQTRISIQDLEQNAAVYHPLQTAFAYWYAYYYGRTFKAFEISDMLLAAAYRYDPENQIYPIKRASNCFRSGKFEDGEAILKRLVASEYMDVRSADLPAFGILTAKTLGKFNLADDFEAIGRAALRGFPYTAACYYKIKLAKKDAPTEALRTLRDHQIGDAPIRAFYRHWSGLDSAKDVMARLNKIDCSALYEESDKWYSVRFASIDAAIAEVTLPGDYAEFGVYKGRCAELIVSYLSGGRHLHLFDSFDGLPEDWMGPWKKGAFALGAQDIPRFNRDDVHVYVGLFKDAIPQAKESFRSPLAFIHGDADLYSSTIDMLDGLDDCIAPGTVILFDEYMFRSGENYDDGEHRALMEWASRRGRRFEYLWRTEHYQVAIRVTA